MPRKKKTETAPVAEVTAPVAAETVTEIAAEVPNATLPLKPQITNYSRSAVCCDKGYVLCVRCAESIAFVIIISNSPQPAICVYNARERLVRGFHLQTAYFTLRRLGRLYKRFMVVTAYPFSFQIACFRLSWLKYGCLSLLAALISCDFLTQRLASRSYIPIGCWKSDKLICPLLYLYII